MHVCRWENPGNSGDPVTCLCRTIKPEFHRVCGGVQTQTLFLISFYLSQILILLEVWCTARHPREEGFISTGWLSAQSHKPTFSSAFWGMLKIFFFFSFLETVVCALTLYLGNRGKRNRSSRLSSATQLVQTKPGLCETLPGKEWKLKQNKSKGSFLYQTRGPVICQPKMHVLYEK